MKEFIVKEYETFPYKNAVNEMPELIRCKDCFKKSLCIMRRETNDDYGYCSWAERKEECQ